MTHCRERSNADAGAGVGVGGGSRSRWRGCARGPEAAGPRGRRAAGRLHPQLPGIFRKKPREKRGFQSPERGKGKIGTEMCAIQEFEV